MPNAATVRVDATNIGLLIIAAVAAVVLPFELFLFSYAVLGPLHYLTEISWLHDKKYYSTGTYDVGLLVVLSLVLTAFLFVQQEPGGLSWIVENIGLVRYEQLQAHLIFVGLVSAAVFAFVKKPELKLMGVGLAIALTAVSSKAVVLLAVFVPTLIHVFVFTSIFMLYGALKSRSTLGYATVALHLAVPFVLFFLVPSGTPVDVSDYGARAYQEGFASVNQAIFDFDFFRSKSYVETLDTLGKPRDQLTYSDLIFNSPEGIGIMRIIAFAYTYHYLNWFSKTEIIRWHQVPRSRFIAVIIGAVASVALYGIDYSLGFKWLFLLSFMHVMLEFPLNYVSTLGVIRELTGRIAGRRSLDPVRAA